MWLLEDRDPTLFYSSAIVNEFLIVLTPPTEVTKEVSEFKNLLKNRFGRFESMYSKAHFTLANLLCNEDQEKKLIPIFENLKKTLKPFDVQLNNIESFKYSGTIYINPLNKESIYSLSKTIYKELLLNGFSKKNLIIPKTPHLTIARKLNKIQFDLALQEFKKIAYKKAFIAKEITILKRNKEKKYEVYHTTKFQCATL